MRVHNLFRRGLGVKVAAAVLATAAAIGFTTAPASAAPFMPATQAGVDALNRNSVHMFPGEPRMPVLLYCRQGTRVQTVTVPGDHGSIIDSGIPSALRSANDRLAGAPGASTC